MKKLKTLYTSLFIAIMFSSCAIHSGMITSPNISEKSNQKYVDIAVGYSCATYVFGFGGLAKDALVNDAKRSLMASYPLKSNQSFQNFTVDYKTSLFPIVRKMEVIVTADVVENESNVGITFSENYKQYFLSKTITESLFKPNDAIKYFDGTTCFSGKIINVIGDITYSNNFEILVQKIKILYFKNDKSLQIKNVWNDEIFLSTIDESLQKKIGYTINQKVFINLLDKTVGIITTNIEAKIIALNNTCAVVKKELNGQIIKIKLSEIKK